METWSQRIQQEPSKSRIGPWTNIACSRCSLLAQLQTARAPSHWQSIQSGSSKGSLDLEELWLKISRTLEFILLLRHDGTDQSVPSGEVLNRRSTPRMHIVRINHDGSKGLFDPLLTEPGLPLYSSSLVTESTRAGSVDKDNNVLFPFPDVFLAFTHNHAHGLSVTESVN